MKLYFQNLHLYAQQQSFVITGKPGLLFPEPEISDLQETSRTYYVYPIRDIITIHLQIN